MEETCEHLEKLTDIKTARKHQCEECIKSGSMWVHLRTCQACGTTLCCDSSPNKHASKHAFASGHPVVISAEHGERWAWCYIDKQLVEY